MNYGITISTSGALTSMYRQNVLTNNLANATTIGFKPDVPFTRQRPVASQEDALGYLPSNDLLEALGAGPLMRTNRIAFNQGPLQITKQPLDVAIQGKGFFAVSDASDGNTQRIRFTRDGRFDMDSRGRLVMQGQGLPILDTNNRPITIPPGAPITISSDGMIIQNGNQIAQIQVVDLPDSDQLKKLGQSLFEAPGNIMESRFPASANLIQGSLEGSAANEIAMLMSITAASKAVASNMGMISYQNRMMERAINTLGRVS